MRFAAAPVQKPEQRSAATDFIRRLVGADKLAAAPQPAQAKAADLPADLDQRVRLVGEW